MVKAAVTGCLYVFVVDAGDKLTRNYASVTLFIKCVTEHTWLMQTYESIALKLPV